MRIAPLISMAPTSVVLSLFVLTGCSGSDVAANSDQPAAQASPVAQSAMSPDQAKGAPTPRAMRCADTELDRSICMIALISADLKANYHWVGGGITSIKADASLAYSVALPQDERTDVYTYEFEVRGDEIAIKNKKESTVSY